MESIAEAISTIIKLFVSKDGWRLWLAACIVFWLITMRESYVWPLYVAIFCTIMLFLLFISWCRDYVSSRIKARKYHELEKEKNIARLAQKEFEEFEYKNCIWKFFAIVDKEKLDAAAFLLDFKKIEHNEYSRFIPRNLIEEKKLDNSIWSVVTSMRISLNTELSTNYELIVQEQTPYGIYLHFEKYFFGLLVHYTETGKREFL